MNKILLGDSLTILKTLESESVQTCVTSPPYFGLRDYGMEGQIGLESTPEAYVQAMVSLFREVKRMLRKDGTLFLNLGDSYGKGKHLLGIPWRVAFALQEDGWILRQDIIWSKPNPMPESVTDRCTKSHEYMFLLSKSPKYYFDNNAIAEPARYCGERNRSNMRGGTTDPKLKHHGLTGVKKDRGKTWQERKAAGEVMRHGLAGAAASNSGGYLTKETRNKRSVWSVNTKPYKGAHFATFPPALIEPCVLAGAPKGGIVLDPFFGSGTTGAVAVKNDRQYIGIELNPEYVTLAEKRLSEVQLSFV